MEVIRFCRDGVLRRSFSIGNRRTDKRISLRVPLRVWENAVDPEVFLKSLNSHVIFDDGLTVGELMANLAPWADTMTGVAAMDFPAFLAETRRPSAEPLEEISHVALRYHVSIQPVPAFEKCEPLFRKTNNGLYAVTPGKRLRTGRLQVEASWDNHAILKPERRDLYDGSESISLSFSPLSDWQHLPIVIETTGTLVDETALAGSAAYLGTRKALTRKDHPNVIAQIRSDGRRGNHEIQIDAPLPTFFDSIVRGFLWDVGFYYTPKERDKIGEDLRVQAEKIDAGAITADENKYDRQDREEFEAGLKMLGRLETVAAKIGLPIEEL